jgi:SagB-type dehydrogenase family enzyme
MTRFLARALSDSPLFGLNEATERLFAYHQATKHTYQSVRVNAHYLDWSNQPDPFRAYEGSPLIELPPEPGFPNIGTFSAMGALSGRAPIASENDSEDRDSVPLDAIWLSRLLWHSMAVSAWKKVPSTGNRYSLRVNPSSGNLHPTETYLALAGFTSVGDGLYHYRADRHALELRSPGAWTKYLAQALEISSVAEPSLIVGLTSIFWREAWKYRDRAYRYCCHDLGHAMMSLLLAARALGLPGGAIAHFSDLRLASALGLTESDEAPMAFLLFPSRNNAERGERSVPPREAFLGIANELSKEEAPYELLLGMHRATILPDSAGPLSPVPPTNPPIADDRQPLPEPFREPARDMPLGPTVRRRRSALDFDAHTPPMERAEMGQLLDFATRDWPADWRGNFSGEAATVGTGADFVTLYLYLHRVRDCEPGVYRWDASKRRLVQLHRANVERVAAYLSLEQALAGNACFAVSMIADLATAAERFGNRGYRYAHFEAGAIGQRLYVGAQALGFNATGIGAFYDDDVHRYLGFVEEETVGSVSDSVAAAEQAALVMLGSPASRSAATRTAHAPQEDSSAQGPVISPSRVNQAETVQPADSSQLPQQVIYHFAVGRAIPDPRIEA